MEFVGNRQSHWTKILLNNFQCVIARQYCWPNIMVHEMPVKFALIKAHYPHGKRYVSAAENSEMKSPRFGQCWLAQGQVRRKTCAVCDTYMWKCLEWGLIWKHGRNIVLQAKTKFTAWMSQCWSLASHLEAKGVYILYICCSGPALRILNIDRMSSHMVLLQLVWIIWFHYLISLTALGPYSNSNLSTSYLLLIYSQLLQLICLKHKQNITQPRD
jgi:hypothetical protein